jgi:hypothetical protein
LALYILLFYLLFIIRVGGWLAFHCLKALILLDLSPFLGWRFWALVGVSLACLWRAYALKRPKFKG